MAKKKIIPESSIKKSSLEIMHEIADEIFGKDWQEPVDTIQNNVHIINNKPNHTIAVVLDPDQKLPAIAQSNVAIKPIGVSCSHDIGYKRSSDGQINYDFGDGLTINANYYDPVRKALVKAKEIKPNDPDFTNSNKELLLVKGKNVDVMISGLNYHDTIVGYASMDEFNGLKKKSKTQLMDEMNAIADQMGERYGNVWTYTKDPKEKILCNRIHLIKNKRIKRND